MVLEALKVSFMKINGTFKTTDNSTYNYIDM